MNTEENFKTQKKLDHLGKLEHIGKFEHIGKLEYIGKFGHKTTTDGTIYLSITIFMYLYRT